MIVITSYSIHYTKLYDGMAPEVLEHIFEPFYSSSSAGGTGLGMIIIKNIVEAHHGTVTVLSTVGQGTDVRIRLPVLAWFVTCGWRIDNTCSSPRFFLLGPFFSKPIPYDRQSVRRLSREDRITSYNVCYTKLLRIPAEEGLNLPDSKVLGVKVDFFRRGYNSFTVTAVKRNNFV